MSRRYAAPIHVALTGTQDPAVFRWRGRRYVVTEVLATWHERRAWWRDLNDGDADAPTGREVWRVQARSGPGVTGVFDLGRVADSWLLLAAHD